MIVRARVILAALDFLGREVIPETIPPALQALHCWLDSWVGNGLIERDMARVCLVRILSIVTSCAPAF
jgi:hypothetical protein